MATLTITGSGTQDFRADFYLDPIDIMQFATSGNTLAVFNASQFSATQILPDVQIIGDTFVNRIRVFVPTDGVFSAAGWTLTNWSGNELTGIEGDKDFINIQGAAGNEALTGSSRADLLQGFDGNDTLNGGPGNDGLVGGFNNDALNGGSGFDYAIYSDSVEGVKVSLAVAGPQNTVGRGIDTLTGIEGLIGSNFNDTLTGNDKANELFGIAGNDTLRGGGGADTLDGGNGNDVLIGGRGKDSLTGGPGKDFFDFNSIKESEKGGQRDKIMDFKRGQNDRIDLRDIDAESGGGNQNFKWIGKSNFHDEKGELRYEDKGSKVIVQGDTNGDGKADFEIFVAAGSLANGDFVL